MRRVWGVGVLGLLGIGLAGCAWVFTSLTAVLEASPAVSGSVPFHVTFNVASSSPSESIVSFTLDVDGDGVPDIRGTAADLTDSHPWVYRTTGTYAVLLTVQDSRGRTDTSSLTVTALPGTAASLSAFPNPVVQDGVVTFNLQATAASDRELVSWRLWYGHAAGADPDLEGTISGASFSQIVPHTYVTSGAHTARLEVKDSAHQVATKDIQITVTSPPPIINEFTANCFGCCGADPASALVSTDVAFAVRAQVGHPSRRLVRWELRSGDGYILAEPIVPAGSLNVARVYSGGYGQTGTYAATLKVWDHLNNSVTATVNVVVADPPAPTP